MPAKGETLEQTANQTLLRVEEGKRLCLQLLYYPLPKYSNHSESIIELEGCRLSLAILDHGWNTGERVNFQRLLRRAEADAIRLRMLSVMMIDEFGKIFEELRAGGGRFDQ